MADKNQFGLDTNYGNTMGLQFGTPIQSVNNNYNLNDYSLNTPQMSSPQFMGMNNNTPTTANTGFKDLMGTAAGQSGAYGLASGLLNTVPAITDLIKFGKEEPTVTKFQRAQTPKDIEAVQLSESQLDPTFNSAMNKSTKDIINLSGGSGASARANIMGANISNARAKANALTSLIQQNKQEQQKTDTYNAQTRSRIDQMNTGIANQEVIANEQNQAAYDAQLNQYKQTMRQGVSNTMSDTLSLFMNMNTTGQGFTGKLKG